MVTQSEIEKMLEEIITDPAHFLVQVKVSPTRVRKKITVLIDSDNGILVDDCASISRQLAAQLDELIEDAYTLEVSSPGVDFPITTTRQLKRVIGKELKVIFPNGDTLKGELLNAENETFNVQPQKKKKEKLAPEPIEIKLEDIKEAFVQVSFK